MAEIDNELLSKLMSMSNRDGENGISGLNKLFENKYTTQIREAVYKKISEIVSNLEYETANNDLDIIDRLIALLSKF